MSISAISHLLSTELVSYIRSNQTNLNLQTLFGTSQYQAAINKRVIIETGVTIGATSTANYALNIPSGFKGRITLVNQGSILGAGGAANSGTGGNAIFAGGSKIYIDNRGTIYSGGGGGGIGGVGGTGGQGSFTTTNYMGRGADSSTFPFCDNGCKASFGPTAYCGANCLIVGRGGYGFCYDCYRIDTTYTTGGAGGAAGNGGRGQGYDGAAASGLGGAGGAVGGTNAGAGGTGGTGGTGGGYGASGGTGNTGGTGASGNYTGGSAGAGGTGGGLSGFYIVNNANVTWITTGTRAGRVG